MGKSLFSILFFISIFLGLSGQKHIISGYISDKTSGERLIGTNIYEIESLIGTITNNYGFYSLSLPKGPVWVMVSYLGYKSVLLDFDLVKDTTISFVLEPSSSEIEEITIIATNRSNLETTQMSMIDIPVEKFKNLPVLLGEADVMKIIQLLPGVQSGTEGSTGIYVRGGGPDQNLFLLDGVPVYNASHLFGFFSVFNPDAVKSVQLYKGGFPARYGERLSSVVDIRMKEGNEKETHGSFSTGIIASKLSLEGPLIKNKSSYIISGRRTYIDILSMPFQTAANKNYDSKTYGGYYFYDLNGKVNYKFSDKNRVFLSAYLGSDKAYLKDTYKSDYSNNPDDWYESKEKIGLGWGNIISALRWNYLINNRLFSNTTITYSRYNFDIDNEFTEKKLNSNENSRDYFRYYSGIQDFTTKVDFDYFPSGSHSIKFGAAWTYHNFKPGVTSFSFDSEDIESMLDTIFGNQSIFAREYVAYIEDKISISSRISMNAGLHTAAFNVQDTAYFSFQPRISLLFMAGKKISFKASYSKMSQFVHLLTTSSVNLPTDLWLPVTRKLLPPVAHQFALGANSSMFRHFDVSLELFYKTMDNLIEYKEGAGFTGTGKGWESKVERGKGKAYGAEVLIEKTKGKTTGWLGYTLSKTDREFENLNFGKVFPAKYDRRHDVSLAITHKFNEKRDIGLVWVYGTGNATTLGYMTFPAASLPNYLPNFYYGQDLVDYESRNNFRMPSYHRLDLGANFHKQKKNGVRTWTISVYNAYSRKNPFILNWDYDYGDYSSPSYSEKKVLKQYSLFPIIPSVAYSFQF